MPLGQVHGLVTHPSNIPDWSIHTIALTLQVNLELLLTLFSAYLWFTFPQQAYLENDKNSLGAKEPHHYNFFLRVCHYEREKVISRINLNRKMFTQAPQSIL